MPFCKKASSFYFFHLFQKYFSSFVWFPKKLSVCWLVIYTLDDLHGVPKRIQFLSIQDNTASASCHSYVYSSNFGYIRALCFLYGCHSVNLSKLPKKLPLSMIGIGEQFFLVAKQLYNSKCSSVRQTRIWGNVIVSAAIKDRRLKLFDNIPINKKHNQL